ncbi:hypothetical protein FB550_12014 [Neobacillus bataviensis]|uniref:Transposase for insertion sequence element IS21-like C-terminal domain-containing protein n=1 Tax=Neobacillus bataviensis TaxID=220685 RepID=A0A561CML1_9BACI|nr:hypothetical protein FB550_12014 [Neobacillus bataviensis]
MVKMNESLLEWLDKIANKKPNQTTKEAPFDRFEVEQEKLLNWNQRPLFPMNRWTTTTVDQQGFISYENKLYSVPYRYKGSEVKIKETLEHHIEIYYELDCIATHPMIKGITKSIAQLKHYKENKKEETKVTTKGLATGHNPLSGPNVEQRSLLVYEEQSKVGEYE